jgi:hypothetical protein
LKQFIEYYELCSNTIIKLENEKLSIEFQEFDFNSKETMIKMVSKLIIENNLYSQVVEDLNYWKSELNIIDKKLSIARSMIPLFNDYTTFEKWLHQNIQINKIKG